MTTSTVVEATGIRRSIRGREVLRGWSLQVGAGDVRALVGMNGAGKTTALRVVLGMLRPQAGTIRVLGADVVTRSREREVWARVGHLVETPFGYPELTARENISIAARLHGVDPRGIDDEVDHISQVLRFADHLDAPLRRASLGTKQKVGIASAFIHRPDLIVLDEPTNALDPLAVVGLRTLIRGAADRGAGVLVTSHHFDELARVAHEVDVLHRGRIVDTLTPDGDDLERRFFDVVLAAEES